MIEFDTISEKYIPHTVDENGGHILDILQLLYSYGFEQVEPIICANDKNDNGFKNNKRVPMYLLLQHKTKDIKTIINNKTRAIDNTVELFNNLQDMGIIPCKVKYEEWYGKYYDMYGK